MDIITHTHRAKRSESHPITHLIVLGCVAEDEDGVVHKLLGGGVAEARALLQHRLEVHRLLDDLVVVGDLWGQRHNTISITVSATVNNIPNTDRPANPQTRSLEVHRLLDDLVVVGDLCGQHHKSRIFIIRKQNSSFRNSSSNLDFLIITKKFGRVGSYATTMI